MIFNSFEFLIFFPVVTLIFFAVPGFLRNFWLLMASYYFYMWWNPRYAILIAVSTLITYLSGILISVVNSRPNLNDAQKTISRKIIVAASLIFNLGILVVFKYGNFILDNVFSTVTSLGISMPETKLDLLLPVGISFYTFQALSYTLDVYHDNIKAEKNLINYALFVSFFPQLVAGPIERSGNLLIQIKALPKNASFSFDRTRDGLLLMLWGFFEKLVIADRAAILVNAVYNNHTSHNLLTLSLATVAFAFQVYCDFDGYTNIARGAAKILGINLIKNFKQPYFATNIQEFWRRWHISLTTWFTDYLYIPLGGNRLGIGRQIFNVLVVFTVSGLWHGASWNYVAWGVLHAIYQTASILRRSVSKPKSPNDMPLIKRIVKVLVTFALTNFAWIFFRASNLTEAISIIRQMITNPSFTITANMGINTVNTVLLLVSILVLFVVDMCHEKGISLTKFITGRPIVIRYIIYLALTWSVIMFGIYGIAYTASQFIYFQF